MTSSRGRHGNHCGLAFVKDQKSLVRGFLQLNQLEFAILCLIMNGKIATTVNATENLMKHFSKKLWWSDRTLIDILPCDFEMYAIQGSLVSLPILVLVKTRLYCSSLFSDGLFDPRQCETGLVSWIVYCAGLFSWAVVVRQQDYSFISGKRSRYRLLPSVLLYFKQLSSRAMSDFCECRCGLSAVLHDIKRDFFKCSSIKCTLDLQKKALQKVGKVKLINFNFHHTGLNSQMKYIVAENFYCLHCLVHYKYEWHQKGLQHIINNYRLSTWDIHMIDAVASFLCSPMPFLCFFCFVYLYVCLFLTWLK